MFSSFSSYEMLQIFCIALPRLCALVLAMAAVISVVVVCVHLAKMPSLSRARGLTGLVDALSWVRYIGPVFKSEVLAGILIGFARVSVLLSLFVMPAWKWAAFMLIVMALASIIVSASKLMKKNFEALLLAEGLRLAGAGINDNPYQVQSYGWLNEDRIVFQLKEGLLC